MTAAEPARRTPARRLRGLAGVLPVRRGPGTAYRCAQSLRFLITRDRGAVLRFLRARWPVAVPLSTRVGLVARFVAITNAVRTYHTQAEMLTVAEAILARAGRPGLTVVEAGCGKGGSTAKLSLVVRLAGGRLHAFDSFRGIPANDEVHETLWGRTVVFREGAFRSRLAGVRRVLARHGAPEVVELHRGWFADTLPRFDVPVDVALLDVDLASATRVCVRHLVPRLRSGGVLFSQDGHLRATVALLRDPQFWRDEVGVQPPRVEGLGRDKLLVVRR